METTTGEKMKMQAEEAPPSSDLPPAYERPKGIKGFYYNPYTQVVLLGFVCFLTPGMFNALNGLGGGGQVSATTADNANSALYATFAAMAFFAGTINNKIGSRWTLFLGTLGYPLYIGSYLATNLHPLTSNMEAFTIAAGAILGICAGLLWTAQGSMMLSYCTESQKGIFIGIFWAVFNLGAVVGASVALGQNANSTGGSASNGTYIGFIILTLIGACVSVCMADPHKMFRTDGTKVAPPRHPSWKTEVVNLWVAIRTDPYILLLFPLFFASNWFYTWQFSDYNTVLFNIRTRALNNFLYWSSQIIGSLLIGAMLDTPRLTRRTRAFLGWGLLFCIVWAINGWAYHYQKGYTRSLLPTTMDWTTSGYAGYCWLYIFFGILDAMWQTYAYWMMGAMSNDPDKLAFFTGFYKSIQSAGAAGVWRADGLGYPFMNIFASTWALLVGGLVFALPMIHLRVKNHTVLEDEALVRVDDTGYLHNVDGEAAK